MAETPEQTPTPQTPQDTPQPKPGPSGSAASTDKDQPAETAQAKPETRDPTRDLLDNLAFLHGRVAATDRATAQAIRAAVQQGADPSRHADPIFRHHLAFTVQDVEKALRDKVPMAPALRTEMMERAASAPGLENERMLALMRSTTATSDKALIRDIRSTSIDIGKNADQGVAEIQSMIEALENRARLAQRAEQNPGHQATQSAADIAPPPGSRPANTGRPGNPPQPANVTINRSVFDVLMGGLRGAVEGATPTPWDAPHTPMAGRLAAFEEKLRQGKDNKALLRAEQNGQAALDALHGFQNGEAAAVMNRIRDAARDNPGGLESVLSEMRPGGRFADLRTQFNSALEADRGMGAAYDKAAAALTQYGKDRTTIDTIIAKRPDATNLAAKFDALDAQIGEASSSTPSRHDGRSMMEDLSKQLAEILQRAVDGVRSMFSRSAAADATARPGLSPGMSA